MLTSHVRAMAHRSMSGEPLLPEVDASLFEEISEDSMMLARDVVEAFGNLPEGFGCCPSISKSQRQPLKEQTWNKSP